MRRAPFLGGFCVLLALVGGTHAQAPAFQARVNVPEAQVRGLPSLQVYPTNRLAQGQVVQVVQARDDGWLEILPPAGSFSWVNVLNLEPRPNNVWVVHTPTQVLLGSQVVEDRPTVRGPTLQRGFILRGLSGARTQRQEPDGVWQAVEPPPGKEVRFILAREVERVSAPPVEVAGGAPGRYTTNFQAPSDPTTPLPAPPRVEPPVNHPLWQRAQEAKKAGRVAEAIGLFDQLGRELSPTNYAQALLCFNEATYLRNWQRTAYAPEARPVSSTSTGGVAVTGYASSPAAPPPTLRLGVPTSVGSIPPETASANAAPGAASNWSGPGTLRPSGRWIGGQVTYRLEPTGGGTATYITPLPGVDLQPYLNREVNVHGPLVYRGDLRANHLTAEYAVPVP